MRRLLPLGCLVIVAACGASQDQPPADSPAMAAAPAPIKIADVTGKWAVKTMPENSDSVLVEYELIAGSDESGWSLNFKNRPPVPLKVVSVAGDSIVVESAQYESVLQPGVQVNTTTALRIQNGMLVGKTRAVYSKGPDSVKVFRLEGMLRP